MSITAYCAVFLYTPEVIFGCFIFVLRLNCKVSSSGTMLLFYIVPSTLGTSSVALALRSLKKFEIEIFRILNFWCQTFTKCLRNRWSQLAGNFSLLGEHSLWSQTSVFWTRCFNVTELLFYFASHEEKLVLRWDCFVCDERTQMGII